MKWIVLISFIFIIPVITIAQAPDTLWTRTFGGYFNDYGHSVEITPDGNYIVAGETYSLSSGGYDIYIIKIDPYGDTLWSKTYGGINSEYGNCIIQTSDSGFAIVGETRSFGAGSYDIYFLKTDADGDTVWAKTYGGEDYEEGWSVCRASDGGYAITGFTRSFGAGGEDIYLVRIDSTGDTLWTRTYGGPYYDSGTSVWPTLDGGFIIAGGTDSFGAGLLDGYIIRIDASGDTLWTRTVGGPGTDGIYSIGATSDNAYILAGLTDSFGAGMYDGYLLKMNDSGDTLWTMTLGGDEDDIINSVQQAIDDGFIIAGWSESPPLGGKDFYIIKTDSLGNIIWSGAYGGPGDDLAASIRPTPDDGYIIAGATTSYGAGNHDVYLIKIFSEPVGVYDNGIPRNPDHFTLYPNYPNPFNVSTTISFELAEPGNIKLAIYDLLGREMSVLINRYFESGKYNNNFIASNLPSGIYFYRMDNGKVVKQGRMVLLK